MAASFEIRGYDPEMQVFQLRSVECKCPLQYTWLIYVRNVSAIISAWK